MRFEVEITVGVSQGDLVQSEKAYKRLGDSAEKAYEKVNKLASDADKGSAQIREATLKAAVGFERFAKSVDEGGRGSERALVKLNLRIADLQRSIEAAQRAGSPVPHDALSTLRQLEAGTDRYVGKLGELKVAQQAAGRALEDATEAAGGQVRTINSLDDVVRELAEDLGTGAVKWLSWGTAAAGALTAGYAAGTKLRQVVNELGKEIFGIDRAMDVFIQSLPGFSAFVALIERVRGGPTAELGWKTLIKDAEGMRRQIANFLGMNQGLTGDPFAGLEVGQHTPEEWEAIGKRQLELRKKATAEAESTAKQTERDLKASRERLEVLKEEARLKALEVGKRIEAEERVLAYIAPTLSAGVDLTAIGGVAQAQADAALAAEQWREGLEGGQYYAELAERNLDEIASIGALIQDVFADVEGTAGKIGVAIGRAVKGMAEAKGAAERWAIGLQAVFDAVKDRNVTAGGFGARGEGNYAGQGSTIGMVIGGIIGAYYGNPQAGMAIGSAAGGILGSFIKKGAQEALAQLELDSGEIAAVITKNEGSLGKVLRDIGSRINDALQEILDQLGGSLDRLPKISMKVRDGVISVWVGAVNARVKEMDDAITFAVTEILKQADISGLSETMRRVLERTQATDLDQLARDLDFGQWYERLGLEDAAVAIEQQLADFRTRFRRAVELGLDTAPITEWLGRQLQMQRNQLLGIQEDPEEALRRNIEAFNQKVQLLEAENLAKKAHLLVEKATLEAEIALMQGELHVRQEELRARGMFLDADTAILGAEISALGAAMAALQGVNTAIAAVEAVLGNLPGLISNEELEEAIRRLGRGAGGGRGAARQQAEDNRAAIRREADLFGVGDVGQSLASAKQWLADFAERVRSAGFSTAEATQLMAEAEAELQRRQEQIKAGVLQRTQDFLRQGTAAGGPLMGALRDSDKTMNSLIDDLRELHKAGELSWRDFRRLKEELLEAGEAARADMVGQAGSQLLLDLYSYLGEDAQTAQLKFDMAVKEFEIRRAELELAMRTYGLLDEGLLTSIDDLIRRIKDAGPPVPSDGGGPSDAGKYRYGVPSGFSGTAQDYARYLQDLAKELERAKDMLKGYSDEALPDFVREMRKVEEDFAFIRKTLGDTGEVQLEYAKAIRRVIENWLQPVLEKRRSLDFGAQSVLRGDQQFFAAQAQFREVAAQILGGDLTKRDRLLELVDLYRELGHGFTAGEGYRFIDSEIKGVLDKLLATVPGFNAANVALGMPNNPMTTQSPGLQAAIETGNSMMVTELRRANDRLASMDARLGSIDNTLQNPISVREVA